MNTTPEQLPVVGSTCTVSGSNNDISETSRGFTTAKVLAYTDDGLFACFQKEGCWPFVHRLDNCSFTPRPGDEVDGKKVPEPWSLTRHIPGFRPLRDGEEWILSEQWEEGMLLDGERPFIKGELIQEGDLGINSFSGKFVNLFFTGKDSDDHLAKTTRPLPEPPKLVPLGPSDWLKDGPWWIAPKNHKFPRMVTGVDDDSIDYGPGSVTHERAMEYDRSNDGINWQSCSKTA